ncbi:hypothetical protein GpartN1_g754.t1 [Galdieria partita]|uniref:DNA-directed RNA polymerases I, II, and III subunit RPABC3 n=1 Tax=Galdieria partita TaxID=83374 RepID=A0A9C7UMU0_9RHOD|nr:hypothetical protein GpartN1_g754.t1 [Galdieria partita]
MAAVLFEDVFSVTEVDMVKDPKDPSRKVKEKKFDKVSRILCYGENYQTELLLDINNEIYPIREKEKFEMVLAPTLSLDGRPDDGLYHPSEEPSLLDKFEYGMYGKIFKFAEEIGKSVVYISFGGLLMALKGEPRIITPQSFEVDSGIYILLRKL